MTNQVPKIIWQTHNYEYEDLPIYLKQIAQTWKNLNPDWEYRYVSHTQREEIVKKYPILWQYYPTQDGVCQSDIWRYLITYEYGGVYADMDSICNRSITFSLENLEDAEIFVCKPLIGTKTLQNQIDIFKSKNFSEKEIELRLKVQTNRNGIHIYDSENGPMIMASTTKSSNYAIKKGSKIMEQIIRECEAHLIENVKKDTPQIKLYVPFLNVIHGLENDPSVSFNFSGFHHNDLFKTGFDPHFWVNDRGLVISYDDYLKKYNLPLYS